MSEVASALSLVVEIHATAVYVSPYSAQIGYCIGFGYMMSGVGSGFCRMVSGYKIGDSRRTENRQSKRQEGLFASGEEQPVADQIDTDQQRSNRTEIANQPAQS